jgi:hypothetical protein
MRRVEYWKQVKLAYWLGEVTVRKSLIYPGPVLWEEVTAVFD